MDKEDMVCVCIYLFIYLFIYIMEYYTSIRNNAICSNMHEQKIILSEVTEKGVS